MAIPIRPVGQNVFEHAELIFLEFASRYRDERHEILHKPLLEITREKVVSCAKGVGSGETETPACREDCRAVEMRRVIRCENVPERERVIAFISIVVSRRGGVLLRRRRLDDIDNIPSTKRFLPEISRVEPSSPVPERSILQCRSRRVTTRAFFSRTRFARPLSSPSASSGLSPRSRTASDGRPGR